MKQEKHVIFPTEIWVFDNVLLDNQIESVVEAVYNEKVKHKVERTVSQSRPDLISSAVYRPLVMKLKFKNVLKILNGIFLNTSLYMNL